MEFQTIWFNSILNYIRDIIKIGSSSTATNPRNISVILNSKKIICVPMSSSSTNHFRSLSITQTIFLHQQQYTVSKNSAWLLPVSSSYTLLWSSCGTSNRTKYRTKLEEQSGLIPSGFHPRWMICKWPILNWIRDVWVVCEWHFGGVDGAWW